MYDRTSNYLIVAILTGMILGVVVVAIFGESAVHVKFLGDIFLNALRMVVIPLLFCSMIVGITNLGDVRKLGRTGLKTIVYFLVTSSISVVIGLILVNAIVPGAGFGISGGELPESIQSRESYSFFSWLVDQIPSNIIGAAAETQVLPIIVFALFFGAVLTTIGNKGRPVIAIFDGINEAIMKIVHIIMWFAPIGIFGLVAGQLASQGGMAEFTRVLSGLGKYAFVVIVGLLIHAVVVLPLILKFVAGKKPLEYFAGMSQALMTAAATASSSATLPVTMECAEEKNDIDKRSTSFVLPLGATINMDGTALYEAVAAMFIAQAWGIDLNILQQITIFATAVLASIGAAGIPEAGLVTMILVLQAVGLPLEGIGLILAIDWFLDRCRTTVNVWGDSIGAAVIATTAEIGLVDRRRKAPSGTAGGDRRFKGFSRRRKEHDDRRDKKKADSRDKSRQESRRRDDSDKDKSRRQSRRSRRKDRKSRSQDRQDRHDRRDRQDRQDRKDRQDRQSRKDQQPVRTAPPPPREEYTPSGKPPADQGKKDVSKTPQAADKQQQPVAKQDDQKPSYGRRQRRPQRQISRSKEKEPADDGTSAAQGGEASKRSGNGKRTEYDVPKFPEKAIDELTSIGQRGKSDGRMDVTERANLYEYGTKRTESDSAEEKAEEKTPAEKPEPESAPASETEDKSVESKEPRSSDEEFAKLDEAVLGQPKARESREPEDTSEPSEPQSTPSEDDMIQAEMSSEPSDKKLPVESSPGPSEPESNESMPDSDEPVDTPKPEPLLETKAESATISEADTDDNKASFEKPEPAVESSDDSTSDEDESDEEEDEQSMWGRTKQRKSSR